MTDKPIFATLALPSGLLVQNEKIIEPFLNEIMELNVDGFYIVAEALDKKYLIDSPMWLSNVDKKPYGVCGLHPPAEFNIFSFFASTLSTIENASLLKLII